MFSPIGRVVLNRNFESERRSLAYQKQETSKKYEKNNAITANV